MEDSRPYMVFKIPVGTRFTAFWRFWYHIYLEQVEVPQMMQSSFGKQTQDGRGPDAGTWQHLANCRPPAAACDTSRWPWCRCVKNL
jgi:hypothetical protein